MDPARRDDLRALFAAQHDGTISTEDHVRLERTLADEPEARQLWFLQCDLETGLTDWAASRTEPAANVVAVPRSVFSRLAAPVASLAAVFVLIWHLMDHSGPPQRPALEAPATGIAMLSRTVGAEWDGPALTAGAVLPPGTLLLKSGAALIEFYSGARVVMEGPTEIELGGANQVFLLSGKINAHVPPQARGFTVDSANFYVVDHGTDFGFAIESGMAAEVHVFTGAVEIVSPYRAPHYLQEGQALQITGGEPTAIPARRSAFLAEAELAQRDAAQLETRVAAWREASRGLGEESGALVHFTFEGSDAAARRIANRTATPAPDTHGIIVGGTWTDGRWPGKRALEFRGEGDRVRFTAAQPLGDLTLLVWVRVSSLPRAQNVLLASDSEQPGALHWHLMQSGALRLEIARDLGRAQADWEAVNSEPFVTPDRFGQWLLLATTFDGRTIRHYGNGRLIGSGASFTPPRVVVGPAELANWHGLTQRRLAAAMDEFVLLARALSPREIAEFYEAGRP